MISTEKVIEKLETDIYPITIIKFLLNKKRISGYFKKIDDPNFKVRTYTGDYINCEVCKSKEIDGILCRQHTSIQRVIAAEKVAYDVDTQLYFYKNEIFQMVGNKLVIVYCPHPKLITGDITDAKVRKINPITVDDPEIPSLPEYKEIKEFSTDELMKEQLKSWFNDTFSIITIPTDHEVGKQNWCLVANK